ncbi:MAG: hypothetical protein RTU63_04700 [Candidatus Thorarchaeota archaeon]
MIQMFEIGADLATIIALALPLITICLCILIIPSLRKNTGSKIRRYFSYLITPPQIGSLKTDEPESLWRQIKVRLFFIYIGIALFLISFMFGEFYQVILDIILPVTQGSTGAERIVTSVVFQSPFSAGWVGSQPWYGAFPLPGLIDTYHEPWRWIFATSVYTDTPFFMDTMVTIMLLFSAVVGLVFLAPLASKTIRRSFLPSLFFFMTGMTVFTKAAVEVFAHACAFAFFNARVQVGLMIVTGDMMNNLIPGILVSIPIILAMFGFVFLVGWKLWKVHYPDLESRKWFMLFVTLSFWIGLGLTIITV